MNADVRKVDDICYEILAKVNYIESTKLRLGTWGEKEYKVLTTKQVAEFYEVNEINVAREAKRKEKLMSDSRMEKLTGDALKYFKDAQGVSSRTRQMLVFPFEAVLMLSFFLRSSLVAKQVRKQIMISEHIFLKERMERYNSNFLIKENELWEYLFAALEGICHIRRSVTKWGSRLDFVINDRIIVECDENDHAERNKRIDNNRDVFFESKGYTVIRYNPDSNEDNNELKIYQIINQILKIILEK